MRNVKPLDFPTVPFTRSQLNPTVGTVFIYWSNFKRYNAVVLPAPSSPIITMWKSSFDNDGRDSKNAFVPFSAFSAIQDMKFLTQLDKIGSLLGSP